MEEIIGIAIIAAAIGLLVNGWGIYKGCSLNIKPVYYGNMRMIIKCDDYYGAGMYKHYKREL